MKRALLVGGTGPTGPHIATGLLERGYDLSVMHSGRHEEDLGPDVQHIHLDPNFLELLEQGFASQPWWDLIIFSYGRLKHGVAAARGRTGRFIAIGGVNPTLRTDPRVGPLGHPANLRVEHLIPTRDVADGKISARMTEARDAVFDAHTAGAFDATYLSFPSNVYGPRAPGPREWCLIRRILDGRRTVIVPDGGFATVARGYGPNMAHGVLLAVDHQASSSGQHIPLADQRQFTMRQVIEGIAAYFQHDWEMLDVPYEFAVPSRAFETARSTISPSTTSAEILLGYRDIVPPQAALSQTIEWLLANRPEPGGEVESRIGAVFDYEREDQIIDAWKRAVGEMRDALAAIKFPETKLRHVYDHPKAPATSLPPAETAATSVE